MRKYIIYGLLIICIGLLFQGCSSYRGDKKEEQPKPQENTADETTVDETTEDTADPVVVVNEITSPEDKEEEEPESEEEQEEMAGSDDFDNNGFYITEITDELFDRINGKSFKEDCTLPREDLRYLHVLHKDIEGREHEGEMILNVHIAEDVLEIMKELYENDYPIEKVRLVDEYGADDELSMEDNNSSSFNFRFVPRTKKISKHGRGLAVDINPLYNPYITKSDTGLRVEPVNAGEYADRDKDFDYKIEKGDLCYDLFISHGFEWGGEWKNSKDYQHFEVPTDRINEWYP